MIKLLMIILRDHIRSQRILVELGLLAFTTLFVLRTITDSQAAQATIVLYCFLVSLYTTSVMADSNEQPLAIQRLLAMPSRESLLFAITGSVGIITLASYLLLSTMGRVLNPLNMPTITTTIIALPSVFMVVITAIIVMLLMTPLIATTTQRLIVLAIVTLPIAWNIVVSTINLSMPQIDGSVVAALTTVWGIMLWPGFAVYNHAIIPDYNGLSIGLHVIHAGIMAGLYFVIRTWFNRKALAIA
jgi:hypothetical protein